MGLLEIVLKIVYQLFGFDKSSEQKNEESARETQSEIHDAIEKSKETKGDTSELEKIIREKL